MKLSHKVLILVGGLLLLESVFVYELTVLMNEAENESRNEQHSKEVIGKTQQLVRVAYNAGDYIGKDAINKDDPTWRQKYNSAITEMWQILDWLKDALKTEPGPRQILNRIETALKQGVAAYADMRQQIDTEPTAVAVSYAIKRRKDLQPIFEGLVQDVLALNKSEQQIVDESPATQRHLRDDLKNRIYILLAANIIFAIAIAIYLIKTMTSRITNLVHNAQLMKQGLPLQEPLKESKDEIGELDSVFHDMARSLRTREELLRESESRVRAIIEGVPVGLMSLTTSGHIEFINLAAESMFGINSEDSFGKHISKFFVMPNNQKSMDFWAELRSKSVGHVSELSAKKNNGSDFPVEFSLAEFEMVDGKGCLASILDITERYEIQQLRQAFVAMVSHELRTPLTSIGGFLNLLAMGVYGDVSEKVLSEASRADQSVSRLMTLINDLLDLEKLESGTVLIAPMPCDLKRIFEHSLNSVEVFAREKSVKLAFPEKCNVEFTADPDRIVQVLVNLISNAVKFSPPNGTVYVGCEEQAQWLRLTVTDQGRGIPAQYRQSIFERFQQVEAGDAKKKGGTGLGLAICKSIIEQHGGNIGVDSEEGKGSTFWFTLPYEND